jgi:hypothetical protein
MLMSLLSLNRSGIGAHLFRSWAKYINRSIILTPEVPTYFPYEIHLTYAFSTFEQLKNT